MDLLAEVQRERASRRRDRLKGVGLYEFMPVVSPKFAAPRHLSTLVEALEASETTPIRACYSVPPRHGKTETVLHAIARLLLRHPDRTYGYVSYSADIARSKARFIRDYAAAAGVVFRRGSNSTSEMRTEQGGGLLATGVGGPLTGHGLHGLFVDDPFKNRQDADSPLIRQRTHAWFTSTALTRVEPGGSVFVVHTRWHKDDLIGRLGADPETPWDVYSLPAIDRHGQALWPERWPLSALLTRKGEVTDYDWDSLFQQEPKVRKGLVFADFGAVHVMPQADIINTHQYGGRWRLKDLGCGVDWGWSDPSAWVVGGTAPDGTFVVVDELYESNVLVDAQGWLGRAKALVRKHGLQFFTADPSSPGNMNALRQHLGGNPLVYAADNAIGEGIRRIATAMRVTKTPDGQATGLVISDKCVHLIRELGEYSYRAGPDGASETPEDRNNHAVDALRYLKARQQ